MSEEMKPAKTVTGTVVSNKMDKTISVRVERTVKHPLYGKYVRRSTKYMAHDESNECGEGDVVIIESTRPISKNKSWRLQKVVSKALVV
ncbi:MAG: 30S ribosomal protein S17 [Gammaproteobacteria bacterium]